LAHGQELTEEKNKNILTEKEKKKNILDTHRPSHGRTYPAGGSISEDAPHLVES
jgi:hypothetical protein